jgi:hypothetical protein
MAKSGDENEKELMFGLVRMISDAGECGNMWKYVEICGIWLAEDLGVNR